MNCAECVTGSNTMMNCAGNCSDSTAFSPAGNSSASSTTSSDSCSNDSLLKSTPELQKTCLKYSQIGSVLRIMRGDAADARADGKGDLDLLVDRGLIAAGAQAAMVVVVTQ